MTKSEREAVEQMKALLAENFGVLLARIEELKLEHIALEQRTSNFAARVTATNKIYRAEIARLRDIVEAPKPAVATTDHIARPAFDAALKALQNETGVKFHAPSVIRGKALKMSEAKAPIQAVAQPVETLDF
jgi:hypothetical protein